MKLPRLFRLRWSDLKLVGVIVWMMTLPLAYRINRLRPALEPKKLTKSLSPPGPR